jgi:hypothetical protein
MVSLTSSHANSITIASSLALRIRQLAPRLHRLGPRPLYEFLAEIVGGSSNPLGRLEVYAAIDPETLDRFGGRDLPPVIRLVK